MSLLLPCNKQAVHACQQERHPIGSINCERRFSKLNLVKTKTRNRLHGAHLNTCLTITSSSKSWNTFPYEAAFGKWYYKRRYGLEQTADERKAAKRERITAVEGDKA